MSGDYSSRNRRMLKRFLPYYKKYSGLFALDMFCSAMTTVCEIALPLIVRQITDRAAHDIHDLTAELIIKIVGFYILLRIIDTAASYYTASGGHIMGARIETDMRNDLFSHLQDMSYSFYDDTKIGQLMSRITNDLFDITELAHHGPENVLMTVINSRGIHHVRVDEHMACDNSLFAHASYDASDFAQPPQDARRVQTAETRDR